MTKKTRNGWQIFSYPLLFVGRISGYIRIKILHFAEGVKNCIRWFPVIWRDRQYDETFLFSILRRKLEMMEKFFLSGDAVCMDAPRMAKEIRIARILASRLEKEKYFQDYVDSRKCALSVQGFSAGMFEEAEERIFRKLGLGFEDSVPGVTYVPGVTEDEDAESVVRKIWAEGIDYETACSREDMEFLGKHLSRKVFSWWD